MSLLGVPNYAVTGVIGGASVATGGVIGGLATRMAGMGTMPGMGVGAFVGAMSAKKNISRFLYEGTPYTNPVFHSTGAHKAYGKRGIDANNLNTNNLVQNLHSRRRKF